MPFAVHHAAYSTSQMLWPSSVYTDLLESDQPDSSALPLCFPNVKSMVYLENCSLVRLATNASVISRVETRENNQ